MRTVPQALLPRWWALSPHTLPQWHGPISSLWLYGLGAAGATKNQMPNPFSPTSFTNSVLTMFESQLQRRNISRAQIHCHGTIRKTEFILSLSKQVPGTLAYPPAKGKKLPVSRGLSGVGSGGLAKAPRCVLCIVDAAWTLLRTALELSPRSLLGLICWSGQYEHEPVLCKREAGGRSVPGNRWKEDQIEKNWSVSMAGASEWPRCIRWGGKVLGDTRFLLFLFWYCWWSVLSSKCHLTVIKRKG